MIKIKKNFNIDSYFRKIILKKGKLSKVDSIMDFVLLEVAKKTRRDPLEVIEEAVINIMPVFLMKKQRIGQRVVMSPFFVLSIPSRKFIGFKWILESALSKKGSFKKNLALEILEAYEDIGESKRKQRNLNQLVIENRSNLRYRW